MIEKKGTFYCYFTKVCQAGNTHNPNLCQSANTAGACKSLAILILPCTVGALFHFPASEWRDLPFTEIPPPYVTFADYNRMRFKGRLILPNLVMSPTLLQEMNAAARVCTGLLARTGCSIVIDAVI